MKKINHLPVLILLLITAFDAYSQQNNKISIFDKVNNTTTKASNLIAVFQPYLLKARQLFYDSKQLAVDVKAATKNAPGSNSTNLSSAGYSNSSVSTPNAQGSQGSYSANDAGNTAGGSGSYSSNQNTNNSANQYNQNAALNNNNSVSSQNYLAGQSLPINNPQSVNNDDTGNLGNQNNGVYGNCLDVMTGTVMGMGEAAQKPGAVDLMFFAPADGQNTYYLMTPGFAKNNSTAGYMTEHVSEQAMQWSDINESEVALTRLTIGQFNQIQNNSQIQSAVRNAQGYAAYYASVGQKLDGQVFAIKMQMDSREVYGLMAVIKQIGTSGSSGYLKIKIKSTGIDTNSDGTADANVYQR
ncbi:hypothetical protein [Mucilaginibacter flavidus]|uniref:hypothetical protein n=1 Tax=Mucilaginibacter flavidus TaxID=2949309 RepID=UPI0020928549|nr:hypothetical protein [Mucilaginibacter flavidus]MCO5947643.1 hypothetical protein [Mucilaginibacter flavidus]